MAECCGQERDTRFCPECGKNLKTDPLETLLLHLKNQAELQMKLLNASLKRISELEAKIDPAFHPGIRRRKKSAQKWESWAKALEDLMERDKPKKPLLTLIPEPLE